MKKILFSLFATCLPLVLAAQYDEILNDPNVIWAAEMNLTFNLDNEQSDSAQRLNNVRFVKNTNRIASKPSQIGISLGETILEAVRAGKWQAWPDLDAPKPFDADELMAKLANLFSPVDTVEVIDVDTEMSRMKVVQNEVDPDFIHRIRVSQLLYFSKKTGEFELATGAIAPIFRQEDTNGNWRFDRSLFWLKMDPLSAKKRQKQPDINSPTITWASRMTTDRNSPEPEKLRPFKDFEPPVIERLLDRVKTDPDFELRNSLDEVLSHETVLSMLFSLDTLVTFDPVTYEEKIMVVKNEVRFTECPRLQLREDWFWDDKKHRLVIRFHSFALVRRVAGDRDNFRYWSPLFWRLKK